MRDQANGRSRMVGFNNLASVVNGRQKMDVSLKPFDKRLTKESILGLNKKVGFVPYTRMCHLQKVRHDWDSNRRVLLSRKSSKEKYDDLLALSKVNRLHAAVFSATISIASQLCKET